MSNPREQLNVDLFLILQKLPKIGKLMVNSKNLGATHERIGTVETVQLKHGHIHINGAEHHSSLDAQAVKKIIIDRTSMMRDKCYPRIDMLDEDDEVLASVIGFDGLEPFDAALAEFGTGIALEQLSKDQPAGERKDLQENDKGLVPFNQAQAEKTSIRIELNLPHFHQQWQGIMPAVKHSMGFINVLVSDFHLHLKGDSVDGWLEQETFEGIVYAAYNAQQQPLGLIVTLLNDNGAAQ